MATTNIQPEMKQIIGALLFGSSHPVSLSEIRKVLGVVAEQQGDSAKGFGNAKESDIRAALDCLKRDVAEKRVGLYLAEVAGGFRFQTDAECGHWLREFLNIRKPRRLSGPSLETLAIIAYRQPVSRSEIEAVRGVNVDSIVQHLLEIQVIRIVGRSSLPGRPILYGTTVLFLEHFGLNQLKDLPGMEQLRKRNIDKIETKKPTEKPTDEPKNIESDVTG